MIIGLALNCAKTEIIWISSTLASRQMNYQISALTWNMTRRWCGTSYQPTKHMASSRYWTPCNCRLKRHLHQPSTMNTLLTRHRKVTVSDPSNFLMVMMWCRLNRHFISRVGTARCASFVTNDTSTILIKLLNLMVVLISIVSWR